MFREIMMSERRSQCKGSDGGHGCAQYAAFEIHTKTQVIKLCRGHVGMLVKEMCELGFVRRVADTVIHEKGV